MIRSSQDVDHRAGDRRVALVTCAALPNADADTRLLIEPLASRGIRAEAAVWNDPSVDWTAYDLAVVRSVWDYSSQREAFLSWARRVPRLANAADVLTWNTDKCYLAELAERGVGVVPTTWVRPDSEWSGVELDGEECEWVIKPAVSLAALDTGRYDLRDEGQCALAAAHVRRLQAVGRTVMLQPYVPRVDVDGETSLVFIAGQYSHAVRKGPVLEGPDRGVDRRFAPNGDLDLREREPSADEMAAAASVLAAAAGEPRELLYARVDLVPGEDGAPLLMELELTEPHLFLAHESAAIDHFASAIAERVWRC